MPCFPPRTMTRPARSLALAFALVFAVACGLSTTITTAFAGTRVPISVKHLTPGAPITLGIPFPQGELASPEHVRVLADDGTEIPSQITPVTTWAPADSSLKWIWVFFFADRGDSYQVEYGPDVERAPYTGTRVQFINNQRSYGSAEITTGPLRLQVDKEEAGGFLDRVFLDTAGDGFGENDVLATAPEGRGSFLDLLDAAGVDSSRAVVTQTYKEKGSGPLHAILRVEGEYRYGRDDNNPAPFVTRIHAYAGKPYVRVLHTITYTGDPDQHPPLDGEHALIATDAEGIVNEDRLVGDERWTQPNDRIAGMGLALNYALGGPLTYRTGHRTGDWWAPSAPQIHEGEVDAATRLAVVQQGPAPSRIPPVPNSSPDERIDGFSAQVVADGRSRLQTTQAEGWLHVQGDRGGVGIGIRHFMKEYPKELTLDIGAQQVQAYIWSPSSTPMNFARWTADEKDGGMMDNFAQGLTKTTELVYRFHGPETDPDAVKRSLDYVLDPAVAHAPPDWYASTNVYGRMGAHSEAHAAFERGMDYKFGWWLFNQQWEPWYGVFEYGDGKNYYFRNQWYQYANNEPAMDYMWWVQFMRTGRRDYYLAGEAMSRHTMDVDNIHWPTGPAYRGDSNPSLDWWKAANAPDGTPYLGMGRRHANQQWTALLSAHVWVPGWIAAYYLTGYHRGLEVATLTSDYYLRRIFGEHGLTGRRLYLSVWNLVEAYDATKDPRIRRELDDRVDRMLRLQRRQGGNLLLDRYGYAQVYVARGLGKYYQLTGDPDVRNALIRHARWVRDNPPLNHEMESYLSSISVLLLGYQLSDDATLYQTAYHRAQALQTDRISLAFDEAKTQSELFEAIEAVDELPKSRSGRPRSIWSLTNGLRVFGWTHAYNIPYLVRLLEEEGPPALPDDASTTLR
jgi:hypothetical protein